MGMGSMLAAIAAMPSTAASLPWEKKAAGRGVLGSEDLTRILALPERVPPTHEEQVEMARQMTAFLAIENKACKCAELRPGVKDPCIRQLLPVQGWYLHEAMGGGVLGHLAAGAGKTLVGILLPMVVPGTRRAALLIPPSLRDAFQTNYQIASQHFRVPNLAGGTLFYPDRPVLRVLAYSELSHAKCATWLKAHAPDMIIADEAHFLKDKKATRVGRFLRFFIELPDTKFFCHSGSLTTRSLSDYGHLSALSLKEGSPLPIDPRTLEDWCQALDPEPRQGFQKPAGQLRQLCANHLETVRSGFRRRLLATRGVVATSDAELPTKLLIRARTPAIPPTLAEMLETTRTREKRPDGEELVEKMEVVACVKQLATGMYLRWKYPRGEPVELIDKWFEKRQAWNREMRQKLLYRRDNLDSPGLLRDAAERALTGAKDGPVWKAEHWEAWKEIEDQVKPVGEAVWVSDYLLKDATAWALESPGIVWVGHPDFGHKLAKVSGLQYFGAGKEAEVAIVRQKGDRSIIASMKAHSTGRDLQYAFSRNLIVDVFSDDGLFEQLAARTHRFGQPKEQVTVDVYQQLPEWKDSWERVRELSTYVYETSRTLHRVLYAELEGL